jgi:hypothetical protein
MVGYAAFDFSQLVAFFWFRRVEYLLRSFQEFKGRVSSLGSKCSVYLLIFGLVLISICRSGFSGSVDLFFWARFFLFFSCFRWDILQCLAETSIPFAFFLVFSMQVHLLGFFLPLILGFVIVTSISYFLVFRFLRAQRLVSMGLLLFFLFFLPRFTLLGFLAISC